MDVLTAMQTRRSVRSYTDQVVSKEDLNSIINAAVLAPSASNTQPWSFIVVQDGQYLRDLSKRIKTFVLENMETFPVFKPYRGWLEDQSYDVFYNTHTLIIICAKKGVGMFPNEDCNLAAENLMLAAHAKSLGTCWIGFARYFLNLDIVKKELGIEDNRDIVAPIIVGFPSKGLQPPSRKHPEIKWITSMDKS